VNSGFFRWMLGFMALGSTLALTPAMLCAADVPPFDVAVNFQPDGTKGYNAAWLGYILARAHFVDEHHSLYPQAPGLIIPTFIEELSARTDSVKIYRELLAKDRTLDVPYFDELVRVDDNAFMSEYVWTFLHQPTWMTPPSNLRLGAFDSWRKVNLPDHHALTKGSLRFVPRKAG